MIWGYRSALARRCVRWYRARGERGSSSKGMRGGSGLSLPSVPLCFSRSAPFDKTANITFSLNADDDNVSAALTPAGGGGLQTVSSPHHHRPPPPPPPQPNANLLEICYKDRIDPTDTLQELTMALPCTWRGDCWTPGAQGCAGLVKSPGPWKPGTE